MTDLFIFIGAVLAFIIVGGAFLDYFERPRPRPAPKPPVHHEPTAEAKLYETIRTFSNGGSRRY